MAKGKKTSSEDKVKVMAAKIENPDLSSRDIEKKTGVNYNTANRIINNEMDEVVTSCNKTTDLLNVNLSIIEEGKNIILKEIQNLGKGKGDVKIRSVNDLKSLSSTLEDAFKQNQLLKGDATENVNLIGDVLTEIQGMKDKN